MEVSKTLNYKIIAIILLLVLFGVTFRIMPHEANFAPVAAIALLSGSLLGKKYAFVVLLCIMLISDMVLGFYSSFIFTWLAFGLIAIYGALFRSSTFTKRVLLGGAGSSMIFFVISNLGVWLTGQMYPPTIAGLVDCFYMALPFIRATIVSDLVYSGALFAVAYWLTQVHRNFSAMRRLASYQ